MPSTLIRDIVREIAKGQIAEAMHLGDLFGGFQSI
jgi:hypothetical protein